MNDREIEEVKKLKVGKHIAIALPGVITIANIDGAFNCELMQWYDEMYCIHGLTFVQHVNGLPDSIFRKSHHVYGDYVGLDAIKDVAPEHVLESIIEESKNR
jgi:hypothetical protein